MAANGEDVSMMSVTDRPTCGGQFWSIGQMVVCPVCQSGE